MKQAYLVLDFNPNTPEIYPAETLTMARATAEGLLDFAATQRDRLPRPIRIIQCPVLEVSGWCE